MRVGATRAPAAAASCWLAVGSGGPCTPRRGCSSGRCRPDEVLAWPCQPAATPAADLAARRVPATLPLLPRPAAGVLDGQQQYERSEVLLGKALDIAVAVWGAGSMQQLNVMYALAQHFRWVASGGVAAGCGECVCAGGWQVAATAGFRGLHRGAKPTPSALLCNLGLAPTSRRAPTRPLPTPPPPAGPRCVPQAARHGAGVD